MTERPLPGQEAASQSARTTDETAGSDAATDAFPWPPRSGADLVPAAARTWRESVFTPTSFFRRMPPATPFGPVLAYAVAVAVAAAGIQLFWDMVWLATGAAERAPWLQLFTTTRTPAGALLWFLFSPITAILLLYLAAAVTHAVLALLGAGRAGFGATLRVAAFSYGPHLFMIVPVLGWMVALLWSIAMMVAGLREVHSAPGWKPAVAVLAPLGCLVALAMVAAVMVALGTILV